MRAQLFALSLLLACGGSSGGDGGMLDGAVPDRAVPDGTVDDGGVPPGAEPDHPVFTLTQVPFDSRVQLVALTQPAETVEAVAVTFGDTTQLWRMDVDTRTPTAVHEIVEVPQTTDADAPLSAVRASDGSLHVVWESDSRNIRYATDSSGAWTESTIAHGEAPSIVLDAAGTPWVAYMDLPDAVVARLDGSAWTTETIGGVGTTQPWTAIANADGRLVVAGTLDDGNLWVKAQEGGAWVDQPIDISDVLVGATNQQALAAGPAGILLTFQSNLKSYAAYRPAGETDFQVRLLGATFEILLEQSSATAGREHVYVGGVEWSDRLVLLAPSEPYWPMVAGIPWDSSLCSGDSTAVGVDAADQPIIAAAGCSGSLFLFRTAGTYPPEYPERCDEAVTALCDEACRCGAAEDPCGYTSPDTGQHSGNRSGCLLAARETLCSNSTKPFEALTSCIATFDMPAACVADGYPLPDECSSLSVLDVPPTP